MTTRAVLLALVLVLVGCGASAPGAVSPASCRERASASALPGQGECCGGSERLGCEAGLVCYSRYRHPGSIGTCMPPR